DVQRFEVRAGQFVFVPGGTVHAIGAGVTLVEVQDNSDCTLRFYDWGRARSVQVEDALEAVRYGEVPAGPVEPRFANGRAKLVDCEEFSLELIDFQGGGIDAAAGDSAIVYVAVAGRGRIVARDGRGTWSLAPGDTWLVPASFGEHRIEASGKLRLLRVGTKA